MAAQNLDFLACIGRPQAAGLVDTSSYDPITLGIELNFANLILVALQKGDTRTSENIIDTSNSVCTCSSHFVTC